MIKTMSITHPLTRKEATECVVRWLNGFSYAVYNGGYPAISDWAKEPLSIDQAKNKPYIPCSMCPIFEEKCFKNIEWENEDGSRNIHPPKHYWKFLEEELDEGSIIETIFYSKSMIAE